MLKVVRPENVFPFLYGNQSFITVFMKLCAGHILSQLNPFHPLTPSYFLNIFNFLFLMKFSRAISRIKWLSGEKTNVWKTISVLVLRALVLVMVGKNILSNLYLAQSVYATGL